MLLLTTETIPNAVPGVDFGSDSSPSAESTQLSINGTQAQINTLNNNIYGIINSNNKRVYDYQTLYRNQYVKNNILYKKIILFLNVKKGVYVYHKNWLVYEDYISGKFDNIIKPYLDFLILRQFLMMVMEISNHWFC